MPDAHGRPTAPDAEALLLQRARVLERLAGSAWHELAQPLGGLQSFVGLLRAEGWTAASLGVDPALADEAASEAIRLARALTELARGSARPVPLLTLIEDCLALARHDVVDVQVTIDVPGDLPDPAFDPMLLRLVIASLLTDAVTALGGPRQAAGAMRWTASVAHDTLEVAVEDTGRPGEPADLDVLRRLVAGEGAALRHEPVPGSGNRVVLSCRLLETAAVDDDPAAPDAAHGGGGPTPVADPADTIAKSAPSAPGPTLAAATVLVVDDEESVRTLVVRLIEKAGLRAVGLGSGAAALDALDRDDAVHLVVADHWMAGMSGLELHARVAERRPDLRGRFVLMSGDPGDADLVAFAQAEGLRILGKPFDLAELRRAVDELADR